MLVLRPNTRILTPQPFANNGQGWSAPIRALWSAADPLREQVSGMVRNGGNNPQLLEYSVARTSYGRAMRATSQSAFITSDFRAVREIVPAASALTMLAVFKIETLTGTLGYFKIGNSANEDAEILVNSSGQVIGKTIRANTTVTSDTSFAAGDTIVAAYVIRNGQQKLWVNGVQQSGAGTSATSVFQFRNWMVINPSAMTASLFVAFGGALSDAELAKITTDPLSTVAPHRIWVPVNVSGGITGTFSSTAANAVLAATGTTTVVGTLNQTLDSATLISLGNTTILGVFADTLENTTLASSGSTGLNVSGELGATLFSDTLDAAGTTVVISNLGTTLQYDILTANGSTTISGSLNITLNNDISNIFGFPGDPPDSGRSWKFIGLVLNRMGF